MSDDYSETGWLVEVAPADSVDRSVPGLVIGISLLARSKCKDRSDASHDVLTRPLFGNEALVVVSSQPA